MTTILILDKAIWLGAIIYHALVNSKQLRAYCMTVQDKLFAEAPFFIAMEDHGFMLSLSVKGILL